MARLRTQARPPFPGLRATRWNHPNESVRNRVLYRKLEEAMEYVGERYARGCLLDIGCGQKPWESLFARYVDEHVGVDHPDTIHGTSRVDVVADAYSVPLAAGTADTVLLN